MPRIEIPDLTPPQRALPDFPPSYQRLRRIFQGFVPEVEHNRDTLGRWLGALLKDADLRTVEAALNTAKQPAGSPVPALLQRHFYWSATCFMRSFQLLLAYLVLDRRALSSWAHVTGYYSRFYGAKAIANLCLASWVYVDAPSRVRGKKYGDLLLYVSNAGVRLIPAKETGVFGRGSHERWWRLFDQLRLVPDFPPSQTLELAFQRWPFTSQRRNDLNYSDAWMRGFPELEWFDQSVDQMLAHANAFQPREDRDFTDLDRFFAGYDPEYVDVADYYTDEVHWLWQPALAYLSLVRSLVPAQTFVTSEKLIALAERSLEQDYPLILDGMKHAMAALDHQREDT